MLAMVNIVTMQIYSKSIVAVRPGRFGRNIKKKDKSFYMYSEKLQYTGNCNINEWLFPVGTQPLAIMYAKKNAHFQTGAFPFPQDHCAGVFRKFYAFPGWRGDEIFCSFMDPSVCYCSIACIGGQNRVGYSKQEFFRRTGLFDNLYKSRT